MNPDALIALLEQVQAGPLAVAAAQQTLTSALRARPYEELDFAKIAHHRTIRQGFPEVVFGTGKTPAQVAEIARRIVSSKQQLLVTRAEPDAFAAVRAEVPAATYHPSARLITHGRQDQPTGRGLILVVTAGTSDQPVAEEAAITAEMMGNRVDRLYDVGVAGLHRLLSNRARLEAAQVIVVVAGMEGALPSVVGGLVSVPVIAVPTSVGYGASFSGVAALLAMLNSCATVVGVVNIDNGFGAGALASLINHPDRTPA